MSWIEPVELSEDDFRGVKELERRKELLEKIDRAKEAMSSNHAQGSVSFRQALLVTIEQAKKELKLYE